MIPEMGAELMQQASRKGDDRTDSSGDRLLAVLALFTVDRPVWTVEDAAAQLAVSATTAYRYFKRLTKAGLISPVAGAGYALGPAIIQMDRQIQISDPMLNAARGVMAELIQHAAEGSTVLLCRLFHDRVMCVHQVMGRGPQVPVSYERGRLMPLYRGATSKIILAHLPPRTLKSLFARDAAEIAAAGLGASWDEFRRVLAALRRDGVSISRSELDSGRVGVAAPIFDRERAILGSLSVVVGARADDDLIARLSPATQDAARAIETAMTTDTSASRPSPARVKVSR
jgi:DNA-binding IclR family transcriptional regulator